MILHIKAPFVIGPTTQQKSPRAALRNVEVVALESVGLPEGSRLDLVNTVRCYVLISTSQDNGDEITSVVVEVPTIIGLDPVVKTNREPKQNECPPIQVWTLWSA